MKLKNVIVMFVVIGILVIIQAYWTVFLDWLIIITDNLAAFKKENPKAYPFLNGCFTLLLSIIVYKLIKRVKVSYHFLNSNRIVRCKILRRMEEKVDLPKIYKNNKQIDSFIQSPLEYVSETLTGNQAPFFKPDEHYQEVLFGGRDEIKYIVAITSENPNLFLDPTIGFYMSNCYAASLVRHVNDYLKTFDYQSNEKPQLCVQDLDTLEDEVNSKRKLVIQRLIDKQGTDGYEFIRFFIYDKNQEQSCNNAIFPSLKASQDLFRTLSYYLPKDSLKGYLQNTTIEGGQESKDVEGKQANGENQIVLKGKKYKNKWEQFCNINEALWHLYDKGCKDKRDAKEVQKRRIDGTIPEFLFVFYNRGIEIHTYLAGHYWKLSRMKNKDAEIIKDLVSLLAEFVSKDKSYCQLVLERNQINKRKTFINWK